MVAGKTHAMGLGPAHLVSLAETREKAQSAQRELLEGINPLEKKRERKRLQALSKSQMMTFSECAKTYIEAHKSGWKSEKHASQWANTLKTYAGPVFGDLPVAEVDTSMVVNCLSAIWTTKHETASRLRGRIERVLGWATTSGYRSGENPARWKGHLENLLARRNVLDEPKNSPSLPWKRIPEYTPARQALNSLTAKALTLLILTGTRSNEVRFATWDEIDLENRCWTIPASRMKAGAEHEIPLAPAVMELLTSLTRTKNLVFPNYHGCPFSDMTLLKVARSIKDQDGGPYRDRDGRRITVQGFRSSFRMWTAEATDYPREIA